MITLFRATLFKRAFPLPARATRPRLASTGGCFRGDFSRYGRVGKAFAARSGRRGLGPVRVASASRGRIRADPPDRTQHNASRRARRRSGARRPSVFVAGKCGIYSLDPPIKPASRPSGDFMSRRLQPVEERVDSRGLGPMVVRARAASASMRNGRISPLIPPGKPGGGKRRVAIRERCGDPAASGPPKDLPHAEAPSH